jgi:hypothetical protein
VFGAIAAVVSVASAVAGLSITTIETALFWPPRSLASPRSTS